MSSLCRDARTDVRAVAAWLGVGMAASQLVAPVRAADFHVQPLFEARAESNTNRNLAEVDSEESNATGYIGDFAAVISATTPRHETVFRPRIRVQEYDDTSQLENVEGFLDLSSQYRTERSRFEIAGNFSHEDLYNAELADARFDDVTPDDPTAPESGNLEPGRTRDWLRVAPSYEYDLSQRNAIGLALLYDGASYDGGSADVTDYDYGEAELFYRWSYSEATELSFGPYASRYEARDDSTKADAYGLTAKLATAWSETLSAEFEVGYEQDDIEYLDPLIEDEDVSGFSALVRVTNDGEVSRLRFVGGRMLTPSSDGQKTVSDEVRLQYDRDVSARLSWRAAVRYVSEDSLGDALGDTQDRKFARAELGLRYRFTEEWYWTAGYRYLWQERASDVEDADNNSFMIGFGYSGLGRRGQAD